MSMTARLRPLAVAAALALGASLSGCAYYDTLKPYQPAAGVVHDAPATDGQAGMKVRNLMLVDNGSTLQLVGTLLAPEADSLTGIKAVALEENGEEAGPLTVASKKVTLPANQGVMLDGSGITATGDVEPGGNAKVTLTFANAPEITLVTPVVDPESIDISPALTPSATPES